jgi:hypothetical protein
MAILMDQEKSGRPWTPGIDLPFAFWTKEDRAVWVKQRRLQTHSNAKPSHFAISADRHVAKRSRRHPLT